MNIGGNCKGNVLSRESIDILLGSNAAHLTHWKVCVPTYRIVYMVACGAVRTIVLDSAS